MTRSYLTMLLVPVALIGLVAGWRVASLSESDMIDRAARDWIGRGGDAAQCQAVPQPEPAWIAVVCGKAPEGRLYQFDRLGRLAVSPLADPANAAKPST